MHGGKEVETSERTAHVHKPVDFAQVAVRRVVSGVHQTVGNRSDLVRYEIGPNSKFKFEFKKIKKFQKNPKNTSRCKNSFI